MDRQELLGTLSAKMSRQLVPFTSPEDRYPIYAVYAEEALTGFIVIADPPEIGHFKGEKAVLLPLSSWVMLTALADRTVTPFRMVAVGKTVQIAAWQPHTGLKYAVRHSEHGHMLHVPLKDFKAAS